MNKKGISAVVATILIIMVTIIAVIVLWTALKPQIETGAKQVGTAQECFYLSMAVEKAVYNGLAGTTEVKVKRSSGKANLREVKFVVDGAKLGKESVSTTDKDGIPEELETITYKLTTLKKPTKIEIAGILKGDVTCPVSDVAEGSEITTAN